MSEQDEMMLLTGAMLGDSDVLAAAVENGTNPNARDGQGKTGLHLIAEHGGGDPRMAFAVGLINAGVDLDALDAGGNTAMHYAAERCDWLLAAVLVASGADAAVANQAGKTPRDVATIRAGKFLDILPDVATA